ncbi:endolytic transglycosylase MltG [Radiobacillus kanasensis]|uniref:endolytic transglycosylase MltG n=1 Tax=Radiobacillus kanasensis TaxID=2844358 RepID=UPI001E392D2E|nr:endolytic transglycosylase MltG [Radiobacillus kanasensis]UFT97784.1 endolytic transglycosylase MltG [Radiobacillus kanasensis]
MKYTIRAFSIGIFTATLVIAIAYFFLDNESTELTSDQMIEQLEEEGYTVSQAGETTDPAQPPTEEQPEPTEEEPAEEQPAEENPTEEEPPAETEEQPAEETPSTEQEPYNLVIEYGTSLSTVFQNLEQAGVIENAQEFSTFITENGYETQIQAGEYELQKNMTNQQVADALTK